MNKKKKLLLNWWYNSGGGYSPPTLVSGVFEAYTTYLINQLYTGNAIRIKRASDSTEQDIPFLSGKVSKVAVDAFTSNGSIAATIVTVYGQYGNGDLTVEAGRTAPTLFYDTYHQNYFPQFDTVAGTASFAIPFGINNRTVSAFNIQRGRKSGIGFESSWAFGSTDLSLLKQSMGNRRMFHVASTTNFTQTMMRSTVDFTVEAITSGASGVDYNYDNIQKGSIAAITDANPTSGRIGRHFGSEAYNSRFDFGGFILYKSLLTDPQRVANITALQGLFSKTIAYNKLVVFVGDSITECAQASNYRGVTDSWPLQVARLYPQTNLFLNSGFSGDTLVQMNTDISLRATGIAAQLPLLTFTKKVAVVWGGTNDLNASADAATCLTRLTTLVSSLKSGGFDKVIVVTTIPRTGFDATKETNRQTYNTSIRAQGNPGGTIGADGVFDADALNWTGKLSDGTHPTAAGNAMVPAPLKLVLDTVL